MKENTVKTPKAWLVLIPFVVIIAVIGFLAYRYIAVQKELAAVKNQTPGAATREEVAALVRAVDKLVMLPVGEEPTVATVNDVEKLKAQQFFSRAENGDKVLIYTNAKKAILYRPSLNKLIEIAPVNIGSQSASLAGSSVASVSAAKVAELSFALRNGTAVTGLTRTYEDKLKAAVKSFTVSERTNARKRDYAETVIVDVAGTKKKERDELAKKLGIKTLDSLPNDEPKPTADFLIILGTDTTK